MNENENLDLLVEVASLYYEYDMNQSEIAKRTFISRSKVSRLLKKARDLGVVEIKINYPGERVTQLEKEIMNRYKLSNVIVLKNRCDSYEELIEKLGKMAADYLDKVIQDDMILGVSWGRTVYQTARAIKPSKSKLVDVVQIIGAAGSEDPEIDAPEIIRTIANKYNGRFKQLNAPLYVEDDYVRNSLMHDNSIRQTLEMGRRADIILTGIGFMNPSSSVIWNGYINSTQRDILRKKGAGFLCAHFFDKNGNVLNDAMNKCIIGLELKDLYNIPKVIAVAGGEFKSEAILGSLRGGYINTLITDDTAAFRMLELDSKQKNIV